MTPSESAAVDSAPRKSKALPGAGWAIVLSLLAYFICKYVPHYAVFTPESYGSDFWPRRGWLVPHIAGGLLAILIGPLQFWPKMRRDYLPVHRIAGRVYVVTVLIGACAAFGLAATSSIGPSYAAGLSGLAVAWLTTTGMAFVAIRRKNLLQHQQWMVRSYVVTFAFVTFRLVDDAMRAGHVLADDERAKLLAWASWAVPLLAAEVAIQSGAIFKRRS
jgi:uncharacterized membrane protein